MAEKDTIFSGKIKQTGNFDFKDFYSFTYDWLNDEGYTVIEKKYSEKVSGESKDIEIIWEAAKKISDYFKFMIKMNWTIGGLKNIEATKDGRKIKTNSGLVEIKFSAVLIKDYESRFGEIKKPEAMKKAEKMIKKDQKPSVVEKVKDKMDSYFG